MATRHVIGGQGFVDDQIGQQIGRTINSPLAPRLAPNEVFRRRDELAKALEAWRPSEVSPAEFAEKLIAEGWTK